jgi:hypothetical protein
MGTCVRTLATLTACEEGAGRLMVVRAPNVAVPRAPEVASNRAPEVASVMAGAVELTRTRREAMRSDRWGLGLEIGTVEARVCFRSL